ncbi:MAG: hypothetical protein E7402_00820 [Ruminococcaceae bacterium]|nr:hypothetical protein [Oscillospiraceae bacterium]
MPKKKKKTVWISGLLALLTALAAWAAKEWGDRTNKALLFRLRFSSGENQSQNGVAERAAEIAATHRCGFAVDNNAKQEKGYFTCVLLTTEADKAETVAREICKTCGFTAYTCSHMKQ